MMVSIVPMVPSSHGRIVEWPGGERVPTLHLFDLERGYQREQPLDTFGRARAPGRRAGPAAGAPAAEAGEPSPAEIEAEIRRTRDELASIPVADIIANHAVGLWQLAVLHLTPDPDDSGQSEPRLDDARLAIDALAALVEGLGERLTPHDEALRDALTQLRLAYVQVSGGGEPVRD